MLGPRAAYSAARSGFSEGAPALRARISWSRSACPGWMLASSVSERLGAAGSVGEQVLRGADTAPPQVFRSVVVTSRITARGLDSKAFAYYVRAVPRTITDRVLRARVSC